MNTLTIDQNIYNGAELYAKTHNLSIKELVESIIVKALSLDVASHNKIHGSWHDYKLSPEVMAMTFEQRKDLGNDYKEDYAKHVIDHSL